MFFQLNDHNIGATGTPYIGRRVSAAKSADVSFVQPRIAGAGGSVSRSEAGDLTSFSDTTGSHSPDSQIGHIIQHFLQQYSDQAYKIVGFLRLLKSLQKYDRKIRYRAFAARLKDIQSLRKGCESLFDVLRLILLSVSLDKINFRIKRRIDIETAGNILSRIQNARKRLLFRTAIQRLESKLALIEESTEKQRIRSETQGSRIILGVLGRKIK